MKQAWKAFWKGFYDAAKGRNSWYNIGDLLYQILIVVIALSVYFSFITLLIWIIK